MIKAPKAASTIRKGAKERNTFHFRLQSFKATSRASPTKPAMKFYYVMGNLIDQEEQQLIIVICEHNIIENKL